MTRSRLSFVQPIPLNLLWVVILAIVGVVVATQPYPIVVILMVTIGLVVLSLITPIAAVIALLILAPMRTLIATEAAFQLPLDIGQIALIGVVAFYAVAKITRDEPFFKKFWTPLSLPLLAFLLVTGLSAFVAISLGAWLDEWLKWIQIFLLILITVNLVKDRQWEWILFGIVLSGVANALIGIYQFFGGSGALVLLINDRFFRAFGTFGQPNPFGGFMGILAPIALMAFLGYSFRAWKSYRAAHKIAPLLIWEVIFYAVSSALLLIGIGMSWSRGAWLGLGGALAVVALALPRQAWRGIVVMAIGLTIFGGLWFTGSLPASIVQRLNSSTEEFFAFEDVRGVDITSDNFAVVERLAHWEAAIRMADDHPILGVGFGNYEAAYPLYRLLNWKEPLGHAHNYYLNILAEAGVLGFLAYGKVWLSIIWITWRARRHPDDLARFVVIGLLGSWVYLSIHSFFDDLYVNNLFLHLGLMLGILVILYNQTRSDLRLHIHDQHSNNDFSTRVP